MSRKKKTAPKKAVYKLRGGQDLEDASKIILQHTKNMSHRDALEVIQAKKETILDAAARYVLPYLMEKHQDRAQDIRLGYDIMEDGSSFIVESSNLFRPVGPDGGPEHVRRVWFALYLDRGKWLTMFHPAVVEFHGGEVPHVK